ncbi:MAG: response regulator [Desulfobulbaceae bacterium]|nr:MAG: response regulator [Desulfobulbaceae bacterium]
MVKLIPSSKKHKDQAPAHLLGDDEIIAIIDDSREILILLESYLKSQNLNSASASTAEGLFQILESSKVALVLLDIGLPDRDGNEILIEIVEKYPDLGIIMVTGTTDLQVALDCLRKGADDYLTKPVNIEQFYHTVFQTLKKRRMAIENRLFQHALELTNSRMSFLHRLNLRMNSTYLNVIELNQVLQAILLGITSEEGLQFNRAFLALFDEAQTMLQGTLAIGPGKREDAGRVWNEIRDRKLKLQDLFNTIETDASSSDIIVNEIVRSIVVPASEIDHPFIHACNHRKSIHVEHGQALIEIPHHLIETLGEDSFVIVPLFSPRRSLGVLIADNFVTRKNISEEEITALEIFAAQASLAIEHSHLYSDMQSKIDELELVTQELERSKDQLVEAERYSALGHMSAQLVHAIRNPVTSIGGTSRLLSKRTSDPAQHKFLEIIKREANKIEATLADLFSFVSDAELRKERQPLFPLLRRSVMIFYGTMKKNNISYEIDLQGDDPELNIDTDKIRQVFLHLIRNGIEAMEQGGNLHVSAHREGNSVEVSFRDSGSGMLNGDLDKATDPFYTTKTYGTGMGLTLVEQILEQHNATFSLSQHDGPGMCARIVFQT